MPQFHNNWVLKSGIGPNSGLANEQRHVLSIINMLVTYDMLDAGNIAGAELAARRVLQIERAVRQNCRQPDFIGLEVMLSHTLDDTGGVVCGEYDRWVAEEQQVVAQVMKQQRQWAEEQDASKKSQHQREGDQNPGKGGRKPQKLDADDHKGGK